MFKYALKLVVVSLLLTVNALACGAGVIPVFDDNTILLGQEHRRNFDTWSDFGGKIDKGETTADAATREFREETAHFSFPAVTKQIVQASDYVVANNGYTMYVVRVHGNKPDIKTIQSNAKKAQRLLGSKAHVEKFNWCYVGVNDLLNAVDSTPQGQFPLVPGRGAKDTLYGPFVGLLKKKQFRDIIAKLQQQKPVVPPAPIFNVNNNNNEPAPAPVTSLAQICASLRPHLSAAELAAIPAGFDPLLYADIYHAWVNANHKAFQMDKPTAVTFYYAKWVLKNANPSRVAFKISPKLAPGDFDSAQYVKNYPHVADEAKAELLDVDTYAKVHYLHYRNVFQLSYKK